MGANTNVHWKVKMERWSQAHLLGNGELKPWQLSHQLQQAWTEQAGIICQEIINSIESIRWLRPMLASRQLLYFKKLMFSISACPSVTHSHFLTREEGKKGAEINTEPALRTKYVVFCEGRGLAAAKRLWSVYSSILESLSGCWCCSWGRRWCGMVPSFEQLGDDGRNYWF